MPDLDRTADRQVERTLSVLDDVLGSVAPKDFAVRLWDGTTWGPDPGERARFTIVLKDPGSLRRMLLLPSGLTVGEAYIYDDFDIEGDVEAIACLADRIGLDETSAPRLARTTVGLLKLPAGGNRREDRAARLRGRLHGRARDRSAIRYHYDISNNFYELWLDRNMVYSCALFQSPDEPIDSAQCRKLDYICRKLRLQPGDRLLDVGCGWGGLVMHAARAYGVDATGITLSDAQASLANQRIAEEGLADRCRVVVQDYRDVDEAAPFDKLVSVGMFEHVGEAMLPEYFGKAARLLKPGGVFLNHGISRDVRSAPLRKDSFVGTYVFPDGELIPISTTLKMAEHAGFEVRDVESLREHYVLTLREWVRRIEARADEARALTDDVSYRIWRLYMAFSAHGFEAGSISVYQTLLAKTDRGNSGLPLTRDDWYR